MNATVEVHAPGAGSRPRGRKWPVQQFLGPAGILGFLVTWEMIPRSGLVEPRFLPPASEVIGALLRYTGLSAFWVSVGETMLAWFLGLLIAVVAAVLLGS